MKKALWILALGLAIAGLCATVEQITPTPGVEFPADKGGALIRTEVFSGSLANGSAKLERVYGIDVYTNSYRVVTNATGTLTVSVWSNLTSHVTYTNWTDTLNTTYYTYPYMTATDTNLSTRTTALYNIGTNVVAVLAEAVRQRQTIFENTLADNLCTNAIEAVYLLPGDKLIFSGTASTNAWLRLIFE